MATYEDGQAGWEIYKDSDFSLGLAEINGRLDARGYAPVSDRMYLHYRKLARYGFENYLPINQLDVKTLQSPVWDRAIRGRYLPRKVFTPIQLRLVVEDRPVSFEGVASQLSEGEAVVRLTGEESLEFFQGLGRTKPFAEVTFLDQEDTVLGQIERIVLEPEEFLAIVRIGFVEGMLPETVLPGVPVEVGELRVVHGGDGDLPLVSLAEVTFWLTQGLEASRLAAQDMLYQLDPSISLELPPPVVRRISHQSPLELVLEVAREYGALFLQVYGAYVLLSRQWWEREVARETAAKLHWENEKNGIRRRFRPSAAVEEMVGRLRERLARDGIQSEREVDTERAEKLVSRQVLPAVQELESAASGQLQLDLFGGTPPALELFAERRQPRRRSRREQKVEE